VQAWFGAGRPDHARFIERGRPLVDHTDLISVGVTSSSFLFINGVAFLIPALVAARGTSLAEAGLLASMPSWGMVVTLFGWGYLTDRLGERIVMTVGSALAAAAYPPAWALCGLFPLAAVPLVPVRMLPPGLDDSARSSPSRA
jgi:MFS family permease